jgi:hypothetical protein
MAMAVTALRLQAAIHAQASWLVTPGEHPLREFAHSVADALKHINLPISNSRWAGWHTHISIKHAILNYSQFQYKEKS